ncbi:MAG: zinc dependent phospholipase C family protein [Oscillatoria sp. PMC 1051.18]|nr:zinc dependent phospholipase C family protein [Oscillatoria sp. PMC 1050.18]MEC5029028.1 zinc dependent phospholipase C family protein [Oscillatoria sp. PMC 1051.18]
MNTYSHFLMTAALDKGLPRVPIVKKAFLLGSIAPDLPLWFLFTGSIIYYHFLRGWSWEEAFNYIFGELFFQNPVWIGMHNFLHAPIVLLLGIGLLWRSRRKIGSLQRWFFWFFVACLLHSVVDILTHATDGPLLFFPFNWTFRFPSPVSYWEPEYYGNEFSKFEHWLDLVLLIYLLIRPARKLFNRLIANFFSNPQIGTKR